MWEGLPRIEGDGSEWTVSKDWETTGGLVHDLFAVSVTSSPAAANLRLRLQAEPLFTQVLDALTGAIDPTASVCDRKHAHHRAANYLIEDGKLWCLHGGTKAHARPRVKCVNHAEAQQLAFTQHTNGGHWGCDAIKIALVDRICSPDLDASIMHAI
ncbi:hypothetical protein DENSPDRAFT_786766, partial [Dentipellis sp. KUC8613]